RRRTPRKWPRARPRGAALLRWGTDLPAIEKTKLGRAVNTPLFVVRDPEVKRSYLTGGTFWYEAEDPVKSWKPVEAAGGRRVTIPFGDLICSGPRRQT